LEHGFGTVEQVTTAIKDYGYSAAVLLNCTMSSERSERPERSVQNFEMTIWFIAEKFKQRGPDRNLYADWIILLKEQFSFRITGFLDFVHHPEF
jgi:hypothetical protein